jgi:hypothetical protein
MDGLTRMHYFDGQRLSAPDFEVEQKYHIEVRRRLNHGLYRPGVVSGLVVERIPTTAPFDPHNVNVTAGIALDAAGREMVLFSDVILAVPTHLPSPPAPGYFLVMTYQESVLFGGRSSCDPASGTAAPSRTLESATLSWTETWPDQANCCPDGDPSDCTGDPQNCSIVLTMVTLDKNCQIDQIVPGVRQYARPVVPEVHPFALEGEKDIDPDNPKTIHFEIRGGPPNAVVLSLWGDAISSLLYTELGQHTHTIEDSDNTSKVKQDLSHKHPLLGKTAQDAHDRRNSGDPYTQDESGHVHPIRAAGPANTASNFNLSLGGALLTSAFIAPPASQGAGGAGIPTEYFYGADPNFINADGYHYHDLSKLSTDSPSPPLSDVEHFHTFDINKGIAAAGNAGPYTARDGPAYAYLSGLQVTVDGHDITTPILPFLANLNTTKGTGPIDLMTLGLSLDPSPHTIILSVPKPQSPEPPHGGKILYNLYVE